MDDATALQSFERYLQRRFPGRSTSKHYLSDLRQFRKVCSTAWADVQPADIEAFVDAGQAHGWKPATLQRRVAALHTFFEFYAQTSDQGARPNPVQPGRQAPKRGQRLPRDLSDEVLHKLWLVLDQPRDQVWFTLMLRGGLRVGEVVALNRGDILAPAAGDQPARLRVLGKGRKERIIYLSADAYAVIARWLVLMPGPAEAPLCPNARGRRLTVNGLQERVQHFAQLARVDLTAHQLRHTYARQLVEHDLPVATLSKLLGHTDLSATQVYLAGADPQVRQAYLQAMAAWETPGPPGSDPPPDPPPAPPAEPPPPPRLPAPTAASVAAQLAQTWATDLPTGVRSACLDHLQKQARSWKPSLLRAHLKRRLQVLSQYWYWQLRQRPIVAWTDLTHADLERYVAEQLAAGRAPSTIKNSIYALWGVLRTLEATGTVVAASLFRLELPKKRELAPRSLSDTEALRLERHLRAYLVHDTPEARREAAWYFVLAHTGIRLNELVDLRQSDLDLPGGRLRINQGKGRRDRVVYLSTTARQALERYQAGSSSLPAEALLFARAVGQPLLPRWVQFRLRQLGDEAGVAHATPHRLRHTLATRLLNQGVNIAVIQKLLGHASLSTTQKYARVADPTVEREYRQAMSILEHETPSLSLAPVSLQDLLAVQAQTLAERVTQPIDNSM